MPLSLLRQRVAVSFGASTEVGDGAEGKGEVRTSVRILEDAGDVLDVGEGVVLELKGKIAVIVD